MTAETSREFEALLDGVGRRGFSYALHWLGNREDALDAVQNALLAVWQERSRLDPSRNPRGWFYRVLRNKCVDQLRRRKRTAALPADLARDATPAGALLAAERCQQLHAALAALPAEQREIVLLRDYHDLNYAELASVLQIAPGTVMSRLHRARAALREQLALRETRDD